MITDNTYARIDLDRITANFQAIQKKAGVPVMAVVKADAYGHGAIPVARALEKQCAFFGVSSMQEALELRRADLQKANTDFGAYPTGCFCRCGFSGNSTHHFQL